MNINDILPDFRLRSGAGGGDPKNGLCYMETVAFIAGECITDKPKCASPAITHFGVALNDSADDIQRQQLLPLVWATAGTRSEDHEQARQRILIETACDMAEAVLHHFETKYPGDDRPRKALMAARSGGDMNAYADVARAYAADVGAYVDAASRAAVYAYAARAYAAYAYAAAAHAAAAYAAHAARAAAYAASVAERRDVIGIGIAGLRRAILAGPNGGIPNDRFAERIIALSEAVRA